MMAPVTPRTARNAPAARAATRCSFRMMRRIGAFERKTSEAGRTLVVFAEHFGLESEHLRAIPPRIARQPGLVAGVRHECLGIPFPFRRDLRQQQTTMPSELDDHAVAADFDFAR